MVVVVEVVSTDGIVTYHTARHNYTRNLPVVVVVVEVVSNDCVVTYYQGQRY